MRVLTEIMAEKYHSNVPLTFIGETCIRPSRDMAECFGEFSLLITQPVTRMFGDVQFPVWISGKAMAAGFIMRTCSKVGAPSFCATRKSMVQGRNALVRVFSPSSKVARSFQSKLAGSILSSGLLYPRRYNNVCDISA